MRAVTPMTTPTEINASPDVVIPLVIVALVVGILGTLLRRSILAVVDELADLVRTYGPVASRRALDRRPGLPATPWFCDRCHSENGLAASRCYRCGARRDKAEAAVPAGAETPAGPSAGLTQRTRQKG
jgi:hypothetical protein